MLRHWLVVGGLLGLLLVRPGAVSSVLEFIEPTAATRVAQTAPPAPPDTLRSTVTGGDPLILALPDRLGDTAVSRYVLLQAPALSGVAGRSFTWITREVSPGTYDIRLAAQHTETAADTLVLRVNVE